MKNSNSFFKNTIFVFFAVFIFSFIFFYFLHPLAVLDFDDWSYISGFRIPLPVPTFWNPSRILPECLMPFCGGCGAAIYRLFPSIGYIRSISLSIAGFISVFISIYALQFYRYANIKLKASSLKAVLLTGIFISLHFLIYRVAGSENQYAFMPGSVTGCFFYIIPALFNASLVLLFESSNIARDFFSEQFTFSKILLLFAVYFAVFSNLFGSIILSVYVFWKALDDLLKKENDFLKHDSLYILILLLWFIAVLFEGMGGRADVSYSFITCIQLHFVTLCNNILSNIKSVNLLFYIFLALAFVFSAIKKRCDLSVFCFSCILTACFLFLLCIKVNPMSMLLPQVRFGFVFFLFVIVAGAFSDFKEILLAITLSLSIFFSCPPGKTYTDSFSYGGIDSHTAIAVSQNCVDQITAADREGLSSVEMHVFDSTEDADNWPQTFGIGVPIGKALLRHGIISRDIEITVFVDSSLNELYNIS